MTKIHHYIAHAVGRLIFDKPARATTLAQLAETMQAAGQAVEDKLSQADDSYANYDCLAHIIGIERWGQRRLQTALGEPLLMDEYDAYRPSIALFWDDLRAEFAQTRQQTLDIIRQLDQAGVDHTTAVRHNELGIMTVAGWIRYLDMHANLEAKKLQSGQS
jgi:hypothetical protein